MLVVQDVGAYWFAQYWGVWTAVGVLKPVDDSSDEIGEREREEELEGIGDEIPMSHAPQREFSIQRGSSIIKIANLAHGDPSTDSNAHWINVTNLKTQCSYEKFNYTNNCDFDRCDAFVGVQYLHHANDFWKGLPFEVSRSVG